MERRNVTLLLTLGPISNFNFHLLIIFTPRRINWFWDWLTSRFVSYPGRDRRTRPTTKPKFSETEPLRFAGTGLVCKFRLSWRSCGLSRVWNGPGRRGQRNGTCKCTRTFINHYVNWHGWRSLGCWTVHNESFITLESSGGFLFALSPSSHFLIKLLSFFVAARLNLAG